MDEPTFKDEVEQEPINVPRAALRFAKAVAYPNLDVQLYMDLLEGLAEWSRDQLSNVQDVRTRALNLADFLFKQLELQGNTRDYNDPRNSYLNEVLNRRLGIPISLAVIYVTVAQHLDLPAYGIGLPGHFLISIQTPDGDLYIDPFHSGEPLSIEDCMRLVERTTGHQGPLQEEWLQPVSEVAILTRMLNNLRQIYMRAQAWDMALRVIEHLRILQPDMPELLRDLGIIHHNSGSLRLALEFYEQYLRLRPNAADADQVKHHLENAAARLARLN